MGEPRSTLPYSGAEAAEKYERLQSPSLIKRLLQLFGQKPELALLPFDRVQQLLSDRMGTDRGTQTIPIASIIGSVGRYRDFDRAFLPLSGADRNRWQQLDIAVNALRPLPPIEVYKISEVYFVRDGHHRVSVAKANGATHVDAHVTEIQTRVPLTPDVDTDDLVISIEYAEFLEEAHLNETRPGSLIELTEPGHYEILLEHIAVHRYYVGLEQQREVALPEAAASWYDTVYLPMVEAIRASDVLKEFPSRTEADLYLWVAYHRERMRERDGLSLPDQTVAESLAQQFSERPVVKLAKTVRRAIRAAAEAAAESPAPRVRSDREEEASAISSLD